MTRAAGRVLLAAAAAPVLVLTTLVRAQSPPPPSVGSTVGQWWKMLDEPEARALADGESTCPVETTIGSHM